MNRPIQKILLGVSGGIAAYKSAELVRRLQDAGFEVRVMMTQAATEFVTPLTFQALSGHPVHLHLFDTASEAAMDHIELARWADLILIAPVTTNTLARLAQGLADDLMTTVVLASRAQLAVAPAMNHVMWEDPSTQAHIEQLAQRGIAVLGPASGLQACGETGEGRMLDVAELVDWVNQQQQPGSLHGQKVLITAGPTHEAIDPVRFIGNRSSGKMGYAIARAAVEADAEVTLVSGPVQLAAPAQVDVIRVESALEMHAAVMQHIDGQGIFIATAAVADYRPAQVQPQKIKKSAEVLQLELQPNPDILAEVAALESRPFCVGFAAETQNLEAHARGKMQRKRLDMIAANLVATGEDAGFNSDYNALAVYTNEGVSHLPRAGKMQIARQLIQLIDQAVNNQT